MPEPASDPTHQHAHDGPRDQGKRPVRGARRRDRHGRGMRGPGLRPGPLATHGVPAQRTRAERFDRVALRVMRAVVGRWTERLGDLELAVEEIPVLPAHWSAQTVPLASYVEAAAASSTGAVPAAARAPCGGPRRAGALLLTVIVEQLAEVLGVPAEEVHPGYEGE